MFLTAQPRDEWFRHVRALLAACKLVRHEANTTTNQYQKDTGTGREARHWVGRQVTPISTGDEASACSAPISSRQWQEVAMTNRVRGSSFGKRFSDEMAPR